LRDRQPDAAKLIKPVRRLRPLRGPSTAITNGTGAAEPPPAASSDTHTTANNPETTQPDLPTP
jgi:hypothetical protein